MALKDIDTIVYVLLENRSFDHMCGYLSTDPDPLPVEGLRDDPAWLDRTANWGDGPDGLQAYPVNQLTDPTLRIQDPPHAWQAMADQINTPTPGGMPKMGGFVSRYIASRRTKPGVAYRATDKCVRSVFRNLIGADISLRMAGIVPAFPFFRSE